MKNYSVPATDFPYIYLYVEMASVAMTQLMLSWLGRGRCNDDVNDLTCSYANENEL